MLPKEKRLNLKKDFKWVSSGKRLDTRFAKLFIKTGGNKNPRIGIAVSSKVFKKATDRNKAKRVISKSFESLYPGLPNLINIVALPKEGVINVKSEDVLKDLDVALRNEKFID